MPELSPNRLREYEAALDAFEAAYRKFLNTDDDADRRALQETIPAAERAFDVAEIRLGVSHPQSAHEYLGLHAVTFVHEQPGFRDLRGLFGSPEMYERVLDQVAHAQAELAERERRARRWPRRALNAADRWLTGTLSIPAYVVGRIIGSSPAAVKASAWGLPLRLLGVVADATAVYFAGRAFGLW